MVHRVLTEIKPGLDISLPFLQVFPVLSPVDTGCNACYIHSEENDLFTCILSLLYQGLLGPKQNQPHRRCSVNSSGKLLSQKCKLSLSYHIHTPTAFYVCMGMRSALVFSLFNEALCLLLSRPITIFSLELAKESILTQLLGNLSLEQKLRINFLML